MMTLCIFSFIEDLITYKYFWSVQGYLNFGNLSPIAKHTLAIQQSKHFQQHRVVILKMQSTGLPGKW